MTHKDIELSEYAVIKCPEGHKYIADGVSDKQRHLCEWIEEWK